MILICDCGSTKAEWVVLDGKNVTKRFITDGFNPNFTDNTTIKNIIVEAKNNIDNQDIRKIFFYGSGCGTEANKLKTAMFLANTFNISNTYVYPDILGACHALFGNKSGIACILGTGSNACFYDGNKITESLASLGFILGDEGSGCHIGKTIVHDYFYKIMPEDLRAKFEEKYHLNREELLKNVYHGEAPSRYLAEFTKFAAENIEKLYIKNVVGDCFEDFSTSLRFARNDTFGFVGSVAFAFKDLLLQVLENHNIKCSKILKNPMDGLIEYYKAL